MALPLYITSGGTITRLGVVLDIPASALANDGSGSAPAYSFTGNTAMGMRRNGANLVIHAGSGGNLALATGSTNRISLNGSADFSPTADATLDLGASGSRYRDFYASRDVYVDNSIQISTSSAGLSATDTARLRYDDTSGKLQVSLDGAAYADIVTGTASGMSIGGAVTSGTAGSVLFVASGPVLAQNNSQFNWDNSTGIHLLTINRLKTAPETLSGLTASTEFNDVLLDLANTRTFNAGTISTQRAIRINPPTYAFASASTITSCATVGITGAPIPGTNATFTNASALLIDPGTNGGHSISLLHGSTGLGLRIVVSNASGRAIQVTETTDGTTALVSIARSGSANASALLVSNGGSTSGAAINVVQDGSGNGLTITHSGATNPWAFEGVLTGTTPLNTARFGVRLRSGASDATDTVKYSPMLVLKGAAWTGSADNNVEFCFQVRPVSAATPTGVFHLLYGLAGGSLSSKFNIDSVGTIGINGQSSDPSSPSAGQLWYQTTSDVLKYRDASATQTLAALGLSQTFTKQQATSPFALTDGTNISVNGLNGNIFTVTLGGNRTLDNPSNLVAGQTYIFIITQDGTGSRTLSYGTAYDFGAEGAPTLTTTASKYDIISGVATSSSKIACTVLKGFTP